MLLNDVLKQFTMDQKNMDFVELAEKFKAIGHPVRVAMFHLLCNVPAEGMSVKRLYQTLELEQPTASRHLAIMRHCGMVSRQTKHRQTVYCLCLTDPYVSCLSKCFINSK